MGAMRERRQSAAKTRRCRSEERICFHKKKGQHTSTDTMTGAAISRWKHLK